MRPPAWTARHPDRLRAAIRDSESLILRYRQVAAETELKR